MPGHLAHILCPLDLGGVGVRRQFPRLGGRLCCTGAGGLCCCGRGTRAPVPLICLICGHLLQQLLLRLALWVIRAEQDVQVGVLQLGRRLGVLLQAAVGVGEGWSEQQGDPQCSLHISAARNSWPPKEGSDHKATARWQQGRQRHLRGPTSANFMRNSREYLITSPRGFFFSFSAGALPPCSCQGPPHRPSSSGGPGQARRLLRAEQARAGGPPASLVARPISH